MTILTRDLACFKMTNSGLKDLDFFTVNFLNFLLRLAVKNFQFLRLTVKFVTRLRLTLLRPSFNLGPSRMKGNKQASKTN